MKAKLIKTIKKDNKLFCIFESTPFQPQGGGQPSDIGTVSIGKEKFEVISALKDAEGILHEIRLKEESDSDKLNPGSEADLMIDEKRRHKLSRMHTAEHLFYKTLENNLKEITMNKVDIDAVETKIFVFSSDITLAKVLEAEKKAVKTISENREVVIHKVEKEKVKEKFPDVRIKLERIKDPIVKITEIKGFDCAACTGTHVNNTREIGRFLVTGFKSLGNDLYEIRFRLDSDECFYMLCDIARKVRDCLGTDLDTVISAVKNLAGENKDLKARIRDISKLITVEPKKDILNIGGEQVSFISAVYPGIEKKEFMAELNKTKDAKTISFFINENGAAKTAALTISPDIAHDAGKVIKKLCDIFRGKGGGSKAMASCQLESATSDEVVEKLKEIIKRLDE